MKVAAKIFKILLLLLMIFIGTTGILVIVLWFNPGLVINEKNLRWALASAPDELLVSWQDLHFQFESPTWKDKHVIFKAKDVCVSYLPIFHACAPQLSLDFHLRLNNWSLELVALNELQLQLQSVLIELPPEEPEEKTKEEPPSLLPNLKLPPFHELIPKNLDFSKIGIIQIQAQKFTVAFAEGAPLTGQVELSKKLSTEPAQLNFELKAQIERADTLKLQTQSKILLTRQKAELKGNLSLTLPSISLRTPLDITWEQDLHLKAKPLLLWNKQSFSPHVDLKLSAQSLKLIMGPLQSPELWRAGKIKMEECQLLTTLHPMKGTPTKADLQCSLLTTPKKKIRGLPVIETTLKAEVIVLNPERTTERLQLSGKAQLSGENTFLQGHVTVFGDVEINQKKPILLTSLKAGLNTDLRIPDFVVWKELIERTPFAIPAPLHVLKGDVAITAETSLESLSSPLTGSVSLQTRLSSKTQKVFLKSQADFSTSGKILKPTGLNLDAKIVLQDVRLDAPPLRLQLPPQVLPDKRFILRKDLKLSTSDAGPTSPTKSPFKLQWSVTITTESPVILSSNLLKAPVPVALDLRIQSEQKPQGRIMVKSFPFEFFRRKVTIDNIDLIFHPDSVAPELSGKLSYSTPEVKARILLLGNTERPVVEFESDPPLSRQQILSVLLFDKSLDELNEDEVNSTTNMSQSMTDGAWGLFSLMFLSNTPIQSISYDPVSQSYTARMRLTDNTTFSVESGQATQNQFTLRRRLKGAWSVRTELSQQSDGQDVVQTLLEWLKRF